jgi:transcriptional regulator with XRE-family HTH domain
MRPHEFRAERVALKLTQDQLAEKLGISKRQIGRYESGRAPISARTVNAFKLVGEKMRRRKARS